MGEASGARGCGRLLGGPLVEGPYLLDTSTMIWALADPSRLSAPAKKALRAGPRVLSVASYWEVVIKSQKGLLEISDPVQWWGRAVELLGAAVLSIRTPHIAALAFLPSHHKDPFDRILIAQAQSEGFALVTDDEAVRRYPVRTLW
ncbi:MAG: type II toxin-antitoxin system VapC family toxin [Bryobacteraceae bacterium]